MTGGKRKQKEKKKFSLLKCIQKLNVIKEKIWVLVFSFVYLVSVDPMNRSFVHKVEKSEKNINFFLIHFWSKIGFWI